MTEIETRKFKIPVLCTGNECVRCSHKFKEELLLLKGVHAADLDWKTATLTLSYDPNLVSFEALEKKATELGCAIAEKFGHDSFTLTGLDCADCALKLESAVGKLPGVAWVSANFATAKLSVEYEADKLTPEAVIKTIEKHGYGVAEAAAKEEKPPFIKKHIRAVLTGVAGLFLITGFIASYFKLAILSQALFILAILTGGFYTARSGFYSLKAKTFDMNFLVTAAVLGAVAIGEFFDGAMVLFLFALGNALETYSVERTRRVLRGLVELAPKQALIRHHDHEELVPVDELHIGEIIIVRPGEKIAMDGVVVKGFSAVNEAAITGESLPVDKKPGDTVFAGSINQEGSLEVKVLKKAKDNTIAKIIHLVEEAQSHKAPLQLFTERFGRIYTPVVMSLAASLAVVPPLIFSQPFSVWFYKALVLLVVACPCSLVISTPVALVSAIGQAATSGVLVKGGAFLEAAGNLAVFAFDKTGTLTLGKPQLTDVFIFNNYPQEKALAIASAIESRSEHPLGQAVLRAAKEAGITVPVVSDFKAIPGSGAFAVIDGQRYFIGSWRFFEEELLPLASKPDIAHLEEQGKTVIFLGNEKELIAAFAFADTVRPESLETVKALKQTGLKHLVILTGDNELAASYVGSQVKVDAVHAGLLPEDKVEVITGLRDRFGQVAMVGDGVNDAPALASASIGIAMGAAGTDVALETADIALMSDDISKLPYLINLSQRAVKVIKQNIAFSLFVVVALILATFSGYLNLTAGVVGHEGSALLVILNGMRLLKK